MRFGDDLDAVLAERTLVASLARALGRGWTLGAAAGWVLDGEVRAAPRGASQVSHDIAVGWLASAQISKLWLPPRGSAPFFTTSLSLGAAEVTTRRAGEVRQSMLSFDLRAGAMLGRTFSSIWTPYLAARAFAGPVRWRFEGRDRAGGSRDHYQLGVGSLLALRWGFTLAIDWAFVGDRTLSVGLVLGVP